MNSINDIKAKVDSLSDKERKLFDDSGELLRQLKELGATRRDYDLCFPFGKRIQVVDDPKPPRTLSRKR